MCHMDDFFARDNEVSSDFFDVVKTYLLVFVGNFLYQSYRCNVQVFLPNEEKIPKIRIGFFYFNIRAMELHISNFEGSTCVS